MLDNILGFAKERAGSLVSKKVGAAVAASTLAAGGSPSEVTTPLVVYVVAQAVVDAFKHWSDSRQ